MQQSTTTSSGGDEPTRSVGNVAEIGQGMPRSAEQLRSLLLAQGTEERVEVNQRHLIDKILARYSSEFTLFRELIQNANDAGATHVEVRLSTGPTAASGASQPVATAEAGSEAATSSSFMSSASSAASAILSLFNWGAKEASMINPDNTALSAEKKEKVKRSNFGTCVATEIEVRNDGRAFSDEDWTRIRKIAEGNPNSESCGMFGVGFYSVFAVAEQPIVQSGSQYMAFHWKGDMLVTTRGSLEYDASSPPEDKNWVSFILECREPMPLNLDQLCKFLVKSVAFTTNVRTVSLQINGKEFFKVFVDSQLGEKRTIPVPKRNLRQLSKQQKEELGFMTISSLEEHLRTVEITAFPDTCPSYRVKTRQVSAQVDVNWNSVPVYLENMKRILKKSPPSRTNILMLYNFETLDKKRDQLVADLYPCPNRGHIYIGFSTHQTTGTGFHIAAQLIPTVERENIDFQDVYISNWNCNLLSIAGQISRLYYDYTMNILGKEIQLEGNDNSAALINLLEAYSFVDSHPSTQVNTLIQKFYFLSPENLQPSSHLLVPSASGVIPSSTARLPYLQMENFIVTDAPAFSIIPDFLFTRCQRFFKQLARRNLVASLTFDEMLSSIQKRQFDLDDLLKLVEWYKQSDVQNEIFSKSLRDKNIKRLLNVVTVQIQEKNDVILQPLAQVKYYVKNKALRQLPLPEGTAHRKIAAICKKDLGFGWTELLFSEWWKFAKRNPQFFVGEFPESSLFVNSGSESSQRDQYFKIFTFIAKQHAQATDQLKQDIVTFLNNRPCILVDSSVPNLTFRAPAETYMPNIHLFKDIVHVTKELASLVGKPFLKQLGVRDTIELSLVLSRLEELSWDIQDLINYLVEQQQAFSTGDWALLKRSAFLPGMKIMTIGEESQNQESTLPLAGNLMQTRLRAANSLYFPHPEIIDLGFEVLAWPSLLLCPNSEESDPNSRMTVTYSARKKRDTDLLPGSPQAQLLLKIGLRNSPSISDLVSLITQVDLPSSVPIALNQRSLLRDRVLDYLAKNIFQLMRAETSFNIANLTAPFLPATLSINSAFARSLGRSTQAPTNSQVQGGKRKNKKQSLATTTTSTSSTMPDFWTLLQQQIEETLDETKLIQIVCAPGICFLNDSPFGFPVVEARWRDLAQRMGVKAHPPLAQIIEMIVKQPPIMKAEAQQIFEYLFMRLNDFKPQDWTALKSAAFIPLFDANTGEGKCVKHLLVNQAFLYVESSETNDTENRSSTPTEKSSTIQKSKQRNNRGKGKNKRNTTDKQGNSSVKKEVITSPARFHVAAREVYDNLLDFVNFGNQANFFLHSCGVSEMPTVKQFAENLITHHQRFIAKNGIRRYLYLLKAFASAFPQLEGSTALLDKLRQTPFCVAYMSSEDGSAAVTQESSAYPVEIAVLKRAAECYLIDNERLSKIFNPPRVPSIEGGAALIKMYEVLGASWITTDVQQKSIPRGTPKITAATTNFKHLLNERKPLLLHTMQGKKRKHLRPDAERILNDLKIYAVDKIERILQFRDKNVHEDTTISIVAQRKAGVCLYIVDDGHIDYFDVGTELAPLLYATYKHDDALLITMLLQTSIPALRRGGWPVDRLLSIEQENKSETLAYHPLQPEENVNQFSDSNTSKDPSENKKSNTRDQEVIESNTYTESSHTRDDTKSISGREHEREMNRRLDQVMRGSSSRAPTTVTQEAGENRTVHYSCEVIPKQVLKKVKTIKGIDLYVEGVVQVSNVLLEAAGGMVDLLRRLASLVFRVQPQSFKMFVGKSSNRIAFNLDRTIYFNLSIYAELHHSRQGPAAEMEMLSFWYMIACHELAHNKFEVHNEEHGGMVEWLAHSFLPALHRQLPAASLQTP